MEQANREEQFKAAAKTWRGRVAQHAAAKEQMDAAHNQARIVMEQRAERESRLSAARDELEALKRNPAPGADSVLALVGKQAEVNQIKAELAAFDELRLIESAKHAAAEAERLAIMVTPPKKEAPFTTAALLVADQTGDAAFVLWLVEQWLSHLPAGGRETHFLRFLQDCPKGNPGEFHTRFAAMIEAA